MKTEQKASAKTIERELNNAIPWGWHDLRQRMGDKPGFVKTAGRRAVEIASFQFMVD